MIYIIEDDENIRNLVQVALNGSGYETAAFETAEEALGAFKVKAPQLAIFDLMLPGMDGITLLKKARKSGCFVPVLILTARSETEDRILGLESGADYYLTKPFEPKELPCGRTTSSAASSERSHSKPSAPLHPAAAAYRERTPPAWRSQ